MDLETKPMSIGYDGDENGQSRQVQNQIPIHLHSGPEIITRGQTTVSMPNACIFRWGFEAFVVTSGL
jgi:hypothetical protein